MKIWLLLASKQTLADLSLSSSTARAYAIGEIIWGLVAALVAMGLGLGSGFARPLVSFLMVIRIAGSIYAAILLKGSTGFWSIALSGAFAVIVLIMLWTARASAFFRTN